MSTQQQFLQFQLQADLMAAIEIDLVTELVNIPHDRIVPMPHLPPAVMGVYNWRGEILWIVDLGRLLGAKNTVRRDRSLQPTIILTHSAPEDRQQQVVGLVVDEIAEIEWLDLDLIQSPIPTNLHPEFRQWASGIWLAATDQNCLKLDGHKIFDCTDFHATV